MNRTFSFTRNLPRPRHSHTPHFRAGRGQLHPLLGAPYCIARYRHPDAAQAWHSAALCQGLQLLNCVSIQDENQMF